MVSPRSGEIIRETRKFGTGESFLPDCAGRKGGSGLVLWLLLHLARPAYSGLYFPPDSPLTWVPGPRSARSKETLRRLSTLSLPGLQKT